MTGARGQHEVLGVVLVLGLTLVTAGLILTAGTGIIDGVQSEVRTESATTAMERFDSRSAMVSLGDSGVQTIDLGRAQGTYTVRPDAGWLRITHVNASDGHDEVLYNETLGAVVYRSDAVELGYQAGGVWRQQNDRSTAVSPPEFHYWGKTLTLPIVRVEGSGATSGSVSATVTSRGPSTPVYPNESESYDGTTRPYRNPVRNGSITASVHSDYYVGWAAYFRSRTPATVTDVDHANETTSVELTAAGPVGEFSMPRHGKAIELRGLGEEHAIDEFELTLRPDDSDSADFANTDWRLDASGVTRDFTIRLFSHGKPCNGKAVDVTITYGNATTTQVWEREDAFTENATAFSYECAGEPSLQVNLTGDEMLSYVSGPDTVSFDHTEDGESATHTSGDAATANQLVNHYLTLMDSDVNLVVRDRSSRGRGLSAGAVDEQRSSGTLHHQRSDVVTFLRITENRVRVELG